MKNIYIGYSNNPSGSDMFFQCEIWIIIMISCFKFMYNNRFLIILNGKYIKGNTQQYFLFNLQNVNKSLSR